MTRVERETIYTSLIRDIETLKDPAGGYIRAGFPHFLAGFGRDGCHISWQLLAYDPVIARNTITFLGSRQGKEINHLRDEYPGGILHEDHPDPEKYKPLSFPLPYYGSIDSTPLFIFICRLYFGKNADVSWLREIWPNILSALRWCEEYADPDRDLLLEYHSKNPLGLQHQGWKDSDLLIEPPIEIVEVQGYYYAALTSAADLAETLGDLERGNALRLRAKALKKAFLEKFWLPDRQEFAFVYDGRGNADTRTTSNPGHLLFTGILDDEKEKADLLVKRLFAPDMWTPYGIRTHSAKNEDFDPASYHRGSVWPHDNWIIAQGLARLGYAREHDRIKTALFDAYRSLGKIPELYAVSHEGKLQEISTACSPQGWASGALLNFLVADGIS